MHNEAAKSLNTEATSDKRDCVKYYDAAMIERLKCRMHMSDSTWAKIIAADPEGWRELLDPSTPNPSPITRS